jgi:hypothetical protein
MQAALGVLDVRHKALAFASRTRTTLANLSARSVRARHNSTNTVYPFHVAVYMVCRWRPRGPRFS